MAEIVQTEFLLDVLLHSSKSTVDIVPMPLLALRISEESAR